MGALTSTVGAPATPAAGGHGPGRNDRRRHPERRFRPDVEGLRGIAVLVVVLYHAALPFAPGGFVGVDVFFVISGYLISRGLLHELTVTGSVDLLAFAARRARRILPAASLVVAVTVVLGAVLLPPLARSDLARDALAAGGYVVNWHFAAQQVDYLAGDRGASPLLHYWSLSVEEQFYVVWPAVVLAAAFAARRLGRSARIGVAVALAVVVGGSFALCVVLTRAAAPWAYLGSATRVWQFGAGAAVAVLGSALTARGLPRRDAATGGPWTRLGTAIGWAGLVAVLGSVVGLHGTDAYPGVVALLPTVGAAGVIAAGLLPSAPGRARRAAPSRVLSLLPLQALGRISYSWYLWHWPVLAFVLARRPGVGWPVLLPVAVLSLVPAWLTLRFVEDPLRFAPRITRSAGRGLALGAAATAVALLAAGSLYVWTAREADAGASGGTARFDPRRTSGPVVPSPLAARDDLPDAPRECLPFTAPLSSPPCVLGAADAPRVVLLGDSHAFQWFALAQALAEQRGAAVELLTKSGCPAPTVQVRNAILGRVYRECDVWREDALRRIEADRSVVAVLVATMNRYDVPADELAAGWDRTLARLTATGAPVLYVADSPHPERDVPTCVSGRLEAWAACSFDRDAALPPDPTAAAVRAGRRPGVRLLDLTRELCPAARCPAVRGGVLLYRDASHLTDTAVRALVAPALRQVARGRLLAP